jgi:NDP-sugar pyrophosphorylase family protein
MQDLIVDYVEKKRKHSEFKIEVDFSIEEDVLGTGGAIFNAIECLDEEFGVMYGDSYLPIDYQVIFEEFRKTDMGALMTVYRNENRFDKSNVNFEKSKILNYSKNNPTSEMRYIDYGFLLFKKEVFESTRLPLPYDLSQLIENLVINGQISGLEVKNRFYEVGSFQGIQDFENYLESGQK